MAASPRSYPAFWLSIHLNASASRRPSATRDISMERFLDNGAADSLPPVCGQQHDRLARPCPTSWNSLAFFGVRIQLNLRFAQLRYSFGAETLRTETAWPMGIACE